METFKTKLNDNPIKINLSINTDALIDGPNGVYITIYHPDSPRKWRKVKVYVNDQDQFEAVITKKRLVARPIIKIRISLIVDDLSLKEQIAETTEIDYHLNDTNDPTKAELYESKYDDDFNMGSSNDQTFNVVKKIKVIFDD